MQTFLPYASFNKSLRVLDTQRLGKQRVEAMQLLNGDWRHHPASLMWRGYYNALATYHNMCIDEWIYRGKRNTMRHIEIIGDIVMPPWLGDEAFHLSHRSNLLRKNRPYYSQFWRDIPDDLEYVWPTATASN